MRYHNELTRGEMAILDKLMHHSRLSVNQLADMLDSNPNSIKVMVSNIRKKGVAIGGGGKGQASLGYKLGPDQ